MLRSDKCSWRSNLSDLRRNSCQGLWEKRRLWEQCLDKFEQSQHDSDHHRCVYQTLVYALQFKATGKCWRSSDHRHVVRIHGYNRRLYRRTSALWDTSKGYCIHIFRWVYNKRILRPWNHLEMKDDVFTLTTTSQWIVAAKYARSFTTSCHEVFGQIEYKHLMLLVPSTNILQPQYRTLAGASN